MLSSSLAFAQGAEEEESATRFLVIPKFEVNPSFAVGKGASNGFCFGNTSLSTLFEGDFGGSNFSYSMEGHWMRDHWLGANEPGALYTNAFCSQESSFIDWAYLTYTLGSLDFSAGQVPVPIGTFENYEYDFDSHSVLNSTVWNNLSVYQWGVQLGWTSPGESTYLAAHFSSSPFGEHPFSGTATNPALYSYSLYLIGEYGNLGLLGSVNVVEYDRGSFVNNVALGLKYPIGDSFVLEADYSTRAYGGDNIFNSEGTVLGSLGWSPSDKFSLVLKGGYEFCNAEEDVIGWNPLLDEEDPMDYFVPASLALMGKGYCFGGLMASWYPLEDNRDLRVHGLVAINNWTKSLSLNIGATYFLDLRKFFRR